MLTGRVRFGPFEADRASGELWRDGARVPLQDLPFRLLLALLARPGDVVTRAELTASLWGSETFVDATAGLNTAIAKLRDALEDTAEQPRYVETIPKRGYRFIAPVEDVHLSPWVPASAGPPAGPAKTGPHARQTILWIAAALVAVVGAAVYQLRADRGQVRVAVMLFDNETGRAELDRLSQALTDATVTELTAEPRLAVIGNAAVLRTSRPFRDIEKVRDALQASYIVIGQVQLRDDRVLVRTHLIRGSDQAHVWITAASMTSTEEALQTEIATKVRAAVTSRTSSR